MMLKNLLGRKGYAPIRVFSSPCPSSRITTMDRVASQEVVKEQEIQQTTDDEKQPFEPEIEELLTRLSPDPWYLLSSETTSLLHIFLDFFPSPVPHKLSNIIAY